MVSQLPDIPALLPGVLSLLSASQLEGGKSKQYLSLDAPLALASR